MADTTLTLVGRAVRGKLCLGLWGFGPLPRDLDPERAVPGNYCTYSRAVGRISG